MFDSISEVIITEPNLYCREGTNVGVQTELASQKKETGFQNNNESTARYSTSLPLHENKSIIMASGQQGMSGIASQLNEITLYEKKNPRRETVLTEMPN